MADEKNDANGSDLPQELLKSRGDERPRSLLDLIEQNMLDLDLASYLVSHISRGASLIVGSGPGGVGKSTTMRALLAFAPGTHAFSIARPDEVAPANGASCVISLELSDHPPPAYLWDQDLRDFFALSTHGHMLVGNMHADELHEVRSQIIDANSVPENQFHAINIFAFVRMEGMKLGAGRIKDTTSRRYFNEIHYSDGASAHQTVFTQNDGLSVQPPGDATYVQRCRAFLAKALSTGERTIEGVRRQFLNWQKS